VAKRLAKPLSTDEWYPRTSWRSERILRNVTPWSLGGCGSTANRRGGEPRFNLFQFTALSSRHIWRIHAASCIITAGHRKRESHACPPNEKPKTFRPISTDERDVVFIKTYLVYHIFATRRKERGNVHTSKDEYGFSSASASL
jgi:hypothetical protein